MNNVVFFHDYYKYIQKIGGIGARREGRKDSDRFEDIIDEARERQEEIEIKRERERGKGERVFERVFLVNLFSPFIFQDLRKQKKMDGIKQPETRAGVSNCNLPLTLDYLTQ